MLIVFSSPYPSRGKTPTPSPRTSRNSSLSSFTMQISSKITTSFILEKDRRNTPSSLPLTPLPPLPLVPSALSPRNSSSSSLLSESAVERRKIDDVELPAWASSPEQFISIHREALEAEYVSAHLHEWINLIFGYQQTGEEARKAKNVFYYLTYENSMNIHEIQDELLRKSIIQQIKHFGQTPTQLFKEFSYVK